MNDQIAITRTLDRTSKGWHSCSLEDGTRIVIVYSTRLEEKGQNLYKILDGVYKNRYVIIRDTSIINKFTPITKGDVGIYRRNENLLILPGLGRFKIAKQRSKIPIGNYLIKVPTYPNLRLTKSEYKNENSHGSRFATTWFQLFTQNNTPTKSFLHLGMISDGCITVQYPLHGKDWTSIFFYLLAHRTACGNLIEFKVE